MTFNTDTRVAQVVVGSCAVQDTSCIRKHIAGRADGALIGTIAGSTVRKRT